MQTAKRDTPAFYRNIQPITETFKTLFPKGECNILEIGSGSGQHVAKLANEFPACRFFPTEQLPESLESIDAWVAEGGCKNVEKSQTLDVMQLPWMLKPQTKFDVVFCLNVIHIAPWELTPCLFEGASQSLKPGGKLFLYGPFKRNSIHTSPSNVEFDQWLKAKDERFGVRNLEDVSAVASDHGFHGVVAHDMPANNFIVEFTLR